MDVGVAFVADAEAPVLVEPERVRSTTQRCLPSPDPCSVLRLAMLGLIPRARSAWRCRCES